MGLCLSDALVIIVFFFNDTATTEIYTLSLHDALPICGRVGVAELVEHETEEGVAPRVHGEVTGRHGGVRVRVVAGVVQVDRKSTRLNSSHANISYAVFCLKKKKTTCIILFKVRLYSDA